ncbi:TRAP transporter large permease subunit [Agromyces sp. CFH 90414]|uniref:TRAP transporter large permease subunit n=1 Tax=Agromyces agglutinans TaxID=2662258 RepID=A0A6I2F0L8_9MICO|nr:TRAP transporter large permease [Agromyces agglutinans]MRG58985.1 TRAP transporter large permease subunit [Agromyces agglutinans]
MTDPLVLSGILIGGLVLLLALGVPVSIAIGLPSAVCMLLLAGFENGAITSMQQMFRGANTFVLVAVPFFVLAGAIMNTGGIAERLINLARVMVGRTPAGLLHTNVIANAIFGTVSGSAVATAAAVGSTMTPMLKKEGYDPAMSAATNVSAAPSGMLIPPSNTLIIYSLAAGGTSIGALFLAGYIPGILWALGCSAVVFFYARRHPELRGNAFPGWRTAFVVFLRALPSLGLIVVAIGGIIAGFFTPTEGSAIAVVYALVLSMIYRTVRVRDLPGILYDACRTSAIAIFLIAVSSIMGYVMTYARIPQLIAETLFGWTDSKVVVLLIMMVVLLLIGIPLDPTPAILIFVPIFLPIAVSYGIDPVHFGIMMVFNLAIAVISPPSAPVLFVGTQVAKVRLEPVIRRMVPFLVVLVILLFVIVFVPDLSLWLPRLAGLIN